MKRIITAIIVLVMIAGLTAAHIWKTVTLSRDIFTLTSQVYSAYNSDDWDGVRDSISELDDVWTRNRLWACIMLSTDKIDEIEISLKQSKEYSLIEAKPDFIGEFKMFCLLMEHIPMQEAFSIEELL